MPIQADKGVMHLGKVEEPKEQQHVVTRADLDRETEKWAQLNLVLTSSLIAQPLIAGKSPEEAVEIFARVHHLVSEWYKATPTKDRLMGLIDSFLPDKAY